MFNVNLATRVLAAQNSVVTAAMAIFDPVAGQAPFGAAPILGRAAFNRFPNNRNGTALAPAGTIIGHR
jgi:hypothetical protein